MPENAAGGAEKSVSVSRQEEQATEDVTSYVADVKIDPANKTAIGKVHIRFTPPDPAYAYLHIYPFLFAKKQTGLLWQEIFGKNAVTGTYPITKLSVQGKPAAYQVDGTVAKVKLGDGKAATAEAGELTDAKASSVENARVDGQANAHVSKQTLPAGTTTHMALWATRFIRKQRITCS
ncbi:hypothetical protein [Brevibacillus borstelensis]|uniref:hypothetical protein n=1 Tax=Brevibacillus borstelensis TaxID=45462 RepID=UPI0030C13E4F